jgi:hypothetical protein
VNKMDKWFAIMVVGVFFALFGSISMNDYTNSVTKSHAIEAGLEQCPQYGYGSLRDKTIWVKDCSKYLREKEK